MATRDATGGFDPSGIDEEAWKDLKLQLEATIQSQQINDFWTR